LPVTSLAPWSLGRRITDRGRNTPRLNECPRGGIVACPEIPGLHALDPDAPTQSVTAARVVHLWDSAPASVNQQSIVRSARRSLPLPDHAKEGSRGSGRRDFRVSELLVRVEFVRNLPWMIVRSMPCPSTSRRAPETPRLSRCTSWPGTPARASEENRPDSHRCQTSDQPGKIATTAIPFEPEPFRVHRPRTSTCRIQRPKPE